MPSLTQQNRLQSNTLGKNYNVMLFVGEKEITKYLYSVRVINNILNSWPIVSIRLGIDCNDIILEDIYGQKELTLIIILNSEDQSSRDVTVFHLLYLQSNVGLIPKKPDSQNQWDLQTVEFSTVPIYSTNLMTMFINEIYQEEDGQKTGVQIIKDILDKYGFAYQIDTNGSITTPVTQTIIPPLSFKQTVDFINLYSGIYNGPLYYNCSHDGIFKMWDLSQRAKKVSIFKIYQLPTGGDSAQKIQKIFNLSLTDNNFYTREPIETIYHANANILKYGYDSVYILHPESTLYDIKTSNIDKISKNFGVANDGKEFIYNNLLKNRKKYNYNTSGTRGSDVVTSSASLNICKSSTIQITLNRNIKLTNILNIGEPVTFEPATLEYMRYRGKYILESYDFQLSQQSSDNWDAICQIRLLRTMQQQ